MPEARIQAYQMLPGQFCKNKLHKEVAGISTATEEEKNIFEVPPFWTPLGLGASVSAPNWIVVTVLDD